MNQTVVVEIYRKFRQLVTGREPAVNQQVGGLFESGFLRQLLDRNPPISKDTPLSIHECDSASTAPGIGVTGIKGDETGLSSQSGNIDSLLTLTTGDNR